MCNISGRVSSDVVIALFTLFQDFIVFVRLLPIAIVMAALPNLTLPIHIVEMSIMWSCFDCLSFSALTGLQFKY